MAPKLKNKPLSREDWKAYEARAAVLRDESIAKEAAKAALQYWYETGYSRADAKTPTLQIDSNLKVVGSIPGWQETKGTRNGYIMLANLLNETLRPVILRLDYRIYGGGLSGRELHLQVRAALGLEPKVSLRMVPFRPWYRHYRSSFPIPEAHAIPATDGQCRHLLGTTLLYYTYVHLR